MKKLNWKHILGALMLSIALTFVTIQAVRILPRYFREQSIKTDFGDFSGDSDYGGGWDSDSSWDSGSSWDGYSSWNGGDIYIYDEPAMILIPGGIALFWFICIFLIIMMKRRNGSGSVPVQTSQPAQSGSEVAAALEDLKARDPGFSETRLKAASSFMGRTTEASWSWI